jgi:hypothetical protein
MVNIIIITNLRQVSTHVESSRGLIKIQFTLNINLNANYERTAKITLVIELYTK